MKSYGIIIGFWCWVIQLYAQSSYFPLDTLSSDDLQLEQINIRYGHTYFFTTTIETDSIFLILPKGLPEGYYEAYYYNDTNRLALVYYNNGARTYGQQFYADGSIKSDTEYNRLGDLHGLHILYQRTGIEAWHAEYELGVLDRRYRLDYLEVENSTKILLKTKKAFGTYEFLPTPSRGRRDRIHLEEGGTFLYECSIGDCDWCGKYKGKWWQEDDFLFLEIEDKTLWTNTIRKFAITATVMLKQLELIEVKPWGVEWYNSEYRKVK